MKLTEDSTIKELLHRIADLEMQAGQVCQESEGTTGCEDANGMSYLYEQIGKLLD